MTDEVHNPYATPTAAVLEVIDPGEDLAPADRATRLGAVLIDGLIGMALVFPIMYASGYWGRAMAQQIGVLELVAWVVGGFVGFIALQGYPLHHWGQTWGKRLLGIRIVDLDGRKPDLVRLLGLRYAPVHLGTQVPFVGPVLSLVDSLMIFRNDRRCLHDLIAGTRVVKVAAMPPALP
ncbi:MAG: RDD family protein [Xanthomonadales bacterium]|nr:RDD family protein [Xanthomonadales bacterium]